MAGDNRSDRVGEGATIPEVANLGILRPPLVYLAAITIGVLLHIVWPIRLLSHAVSVPLGVSLVCGAVALFVAAVRTMRKANTPIPGNLPTTTIVRAGPYRFSRNPIYLAFSLLQLGIAIWVNSVALLITLMPAVALMALVVIPREERYLAARFPSEYSSYKSAVRRWL